MRRKQKTEQGIYRNLIIDNKNDEIENTYCYLLLEEGFFDVIKLEEIINYAINKKLNLSEKEILKWIIECIDNSFVYHKDENDYYTIKNYSLIIENNWNSKWKPCLENRL